jgi:integrase
MGWKSEIRPAEIRRKPAKREPFSWEQVGRLIEHAEGEWKTAIMLGAFTGQRLGDCTTIAWENVDFEGSVT